MAGAAVKAAWGSLCLGAIAGLSLGAPMGWLTLQASLTTLAWVLSRDELAPNAAARVLGLFALSLNLTGHAGFALGVPADVRLLALLPLSALVLVHAAAAWTIAQLAFRLPVSGSVKLAGALPALWTLQEWLFSQGTLAVPWLGVGHVQVDGPFAGALPLGGVLLAGWLSFAAASLVVIAWRAKGRGKAIAGVGGAAVLGLLTLCTHHEWTRPAGGVEVALVQSGLDSDTKVRPEVLPDILSRYQREALQTSAQLVVTPQLAIPKTPGALPPGYLSRLQGALALRGADALIGMYFDGPDHKGLFNGVLGLGASGPQHYLKSQLFPFGEFLPFSGVLRRWVNSRMSSPMQDTLRAAHTGEALPVAGHRAAVAVCYEAAFGEQWRQRAANADLLVNMASDSAIDSEQVARQTLQIDRARAMELRKSLARTSDVRGTYFIDAAGHLVSRLGDRKPGTLRARMEARAGLTPYGRWGDAVPLCVALFSLALCLLHLLYRERHGASTESRSCLPSEGLPSQAGVVLPAAIALLLIVGATFYLMVNAGQAVTEKIRVTNAADAAAYSAAVVEARALNYDAYLNRAIIANQIGIAQMVSFASWVNYFATASDNFHASAEDVNFFILPNPDVAVLDVVFGGTEFITHYYGTTAQEYADYIVNYGAGPIITVLDAAVQILAASEVAVHANLAAGVRQQQIADEVVKAMDPKLSAEVVLASHGFDTFTKSWSGDDRERLRDVTMRSRDQFTRERNWTLDSFDIPFVRQNGALKKRAGTELIGYDEWRAVDTLELHGQRFGCGRFGLSWCDDIRTPVGWGGIEVDAGGGDEGHGYHGNAYNENPTTADRADSAMTTPDYAMFHGLPAVREIQDVDPAHEATTGITVRVQKSQTDTLTSGNAAQAKPSGELALFNDHPAGGKVVALSRAQVFFDRIAARADGKAELGSLYNPYWRVRLVAPTLADKAYAATKQGGLVLP